MQKIIVLGAVALIVILAGIFLLKRTNKSNLTIVRDEGVVEYQASGSDFIVVDKDEMDVPNHSVVKTGTDGAAHVILPDDSMISLSANTEMKIDYDDGNTDVFQTLGNAWFRVQKLAGKREFTVETPTNVAAVRGTIFGVERSATGEEIMYVTESAVEIAKVSDRENIQTLGENKLATLGEGDAEIIDIPEEKKLTPWFRKRLNYLKASSNPQTYRLQFPKFPDETF